MNRMLDRKDKLDVLVLTGQRREQFDKSSGSSKVIQDLSVWSSDFVVMGSNFHKRPCEGREMKMKMREDRSHDYSREG